jgi:hypothetical protein
MAEQAVLNERYALADRPLAGGGMGEVWLAHDLRLDRTVAIKLIRLRGDAGDAGRIKRFFREAQLTARVNHPGIPAIYDLGAASDGRPFLVLERISGVNVDDVLGEDGPLPGPWVAAIGAQVAAVLMATEGLGLVHRDIKPGNLMLDASGAVKVIDFGVGAFLDDSSGARITGTNEMVGTLAYAAPEQIYPDAPVTGKADIYGLGCTLFDLATGQTPFTGTSMSIAQDQLRANPPRLRLGNDLLPAALEVLVLAMLAKHPADRPAARDVFEALLPMTHDLPVLPGRLAPRHDPARAYACVSARIPDGEAEMPPTPQEMTRAVLAQVRLDVEKLMARDDAAAAGQLAQAVFPAAQHAFGSDDPEVIAIRELHARALGREGKHRGAARQHRLLATDLAVRFGQFDDRVLAHRLEAAKAHARMGEISRARSQLSAALQDQSRVRNEQSPLAAQLRAELAALEAGGSGNVQHPSG